MTIKTISSIALLWALSVTSLIAQDEAARVSATWQVLKYDISATLPPTDADRKLSVSAKIDAKNVSSRPASTLTLRISPSAEITSIAVNGTAVDASKREEKIGSGVLQQLVIRVPSVPAGGGIAVTVDYKLSVKDNSGLGAISSSGSQFLPLSHWYPTPNSWYFARGADHAPFSIRVNTPAGLTALSSGTQTGSTFETRLNGQPFFAAGSWEMSEQPGATLYLPKGLDSMGNSRASELAAIAAEARVFVEKVLGPMTGIKVRLVAVSRGAGFSAGGTIFIDEAVLRRPRVDSQTALSIAEAIAKISLGGQADIAGDGGGAVREGLSRYLATQFLEEKFGKDVADVERLRQRVAYAAVVQRDAPINTVAPLDDYYYSVVANKGAMIWRLLALKTGAAEFGSRLRAALENKEASLAEIRSLFPEQKEFLDYGFDQTTDMNLLAGLPQRSAGESKVALRNTGSVDATVDVEAVLENGERVSAPATIRTKNFGEVVFKTPQRIARVEVDRQKLYPQTDFSDDVAPRELSDSDPLLAVKRFFDKQEYANAEKTARLVLSDFPRFDDVRVLLARSVLAQNRTVEAEKEFQAVLSEKLPTSRSIGWALVGLADVALRSDLKEKAIGLATEAIRADAEYGASLAARNIRTRAGARSSADASIAGFFEQWDRAAAANQKAQLDALVMPGEASRFSGSVAGQTAAWKTEITNVDMIDANTALVETNLAIKLLNREPESGLAVFRLVRSSGSGWRIRAVEVFEVR
ncbi:MAG: hypothetical protein AB7V18_00935 [Pyrinomonadaceae bacterium]